MLCRAFNLDDVAADFRPTPKLRPSPYQLTDLKLDKRREVSRIKVPSRFGRLEDVPVPCCLSIQAVGSKRIAVRKLTTAAGPMGWKAEAERVERLDLARTLVGLARAVAKHSLVLSALEGVEVEDIAFLFGDRAPGTLRKHLSGWRRWASYCQGCAVDAGSPTAKELLDFLLALAEGARSDRGSQRVGAARSVVHAIKFMAFKLELHKFHTLLAGPTVCAWLSSAKWDRAPPNEALPLPLFASWKKLLLRARKKTLGCLVVCSSCYGGPSDSVTDSALIWHRYKLKMV